MRAGCITLMVLLMLLNVCFLWLFLTVPSVGLQCVVVAFPGHTRLLLTTFMYFVIVKK